MNNFIKYIIKNKKSNSIFLINYLSSLIGINILNEKDILTSLIDAGIIFLPIFSIYSIIDYKTNKLTLHK